MAFSLQPKNFTFLFLQIFVLFALFLIIPLAFFRQQVSSSLLAISQKLSSDPPVCNGPNLNTTQTIFHEHYQFQTWDDTADHLWHALIPPNGGFIIDESNIESPLYGIAMFHQLHCIQMFRSNFQELYARIDGRSDGKENVLHHVDEQHTLHCLDYLRQVFLCYADGSIEPTSPDPEQEGGAKTDGMVPHYCGNPDLWYEKSRMSRFLNGTVLTPPDHDHNKRS